jgi:hypothetical protein
MTAFNDPGADAGRTTSPDPAGLNAPPPAYDAYDLPLAPDPPSYKPEPLFSKKVMILWASLALGLWIVAKLVIPAVFVDVRDSLKATIDASEAQSRNGNGPQKITITRNGKVITIKTGRDGTSITKTEVAPEAGAAAAPKASTAQPATPVPPSPAPPPAAEKKR